VLCSGRSGSTLLRFILDAHPSLACPPETNLPALCAQLTTVWSLIEGAPLASEPGAQSPEIPEVAITGARLTMDMMVDSYLARRGSLRFCDKSLGTARFARLLLRVYPEAKFLCLYRHPMDVIASAIEACPWGVAGYGFDPYVAASPGNVLLAVARYWTDNALAILAAEEQFSHACHRVRYEDLAIDPEGTAAGIFGFLGEAPAPGIVQRCFTEERERSGPSDYKIWHTSKVDTASIGRGWTIPGGPLLAPVLEQMNAVLDRLDYVQVDAEWGITTFPGDVRADVLAGAEREPKAREAGTDATSGPGTAFVGERLRAGLTRLGEGFAHRWSQHLAVPFGVIVTGSSRTDGQRGWCVDLTGRSVSPLASDDDTDWDIFGPAGAWQAVLSKGVNLGVVLRRQDLRYRDTGEDVPAGGAESRIDMLADFLGLSGWPSTPGRQPAAHDLRQAAQIVAAEQ
jgi:hypothetical protein